MFNTPEVAGLVLFVFYAVSLTKTPFTKLIRDEDWQTWAIRLWAVLLGVAGAVINGHFGNNLAWDGAPMYDAVKNGVIGGIGAIITYHVGAGDFLSAFDGPDVLPAGPAAPVKQQVQVDVTANTADAEASLDRVAAKVAAVHAAVDALPVALVPAVQPPTPPPMAAVEDAPAQTEAGSAA